MKKYVMLLASAVALSVPAHAEDKPASPETAVAAKGSADADYVVMKIGDDEVKRSEIEKVWKMVFPGGNAPDFDTLDKRIKNNLLRGVANEHMLLKEAKKSPLVDSPDVRERVRSAENQILIQEFLKEKTEGAVTEDKIKAAYEEQLKSRPANKEEVHARHILVKTEAEANALEKKLKKGASFEALAKEKSEDKASGLQGGDLGWFDETKMTPEFSRAAFALKEGQISDPVKTDFGWHILKVEERRKAPPLSFEQMHDEIKNQLGRKAVADYVKSISQGVKVSVFNAKGMEMPLAEDPPMPVAPAGDSGKE